MDFRDRSDEIKEKLGILRKTIYRSTKSKIGIEQPMRKTYAQKIQPKRPKCSGNPKNLVLTKKKTVHRNNN